MSPTSKRVPDKNKGPNYNLFLSMSTAAVLTAVVLILLGRIAVSSTTAVSPVSKPPLTAAPGPSTSTPTAYPPISHPVASTGNASNATTIPVSSPVVTPTALSTVIATTPPVAVLPVSSLSKGSLNAPVTIIEYSDFQCAHCQEFAMTVEKELEATYINTGKARLIYKFIAGFGAESREANLAAAAAAEQGQFWPYYELLMQLRASPSVNGDITDEKLITLAAKLNLDIQKFSDSLLNSKYAAYVDKDDADGRAMGIDSTPTFFINGIKKAGAKSLQDLQNIIDPILEKLSQ
jgi:protein-disulfide isomerase